ncbi:hypothetical protein TEA_007935 [Camellia sinensis var. sinensis]|uniref:Transketolase signature 1 domain-containing protein n=1 Tax=Camellia sinensis var. sinensis TaxID=542762 RepID=A0A4S4EBB2_CAMSN|nr:hypothetical protein TEA_007935 [Camellia sinensis var. sinensis]
MGSCGVIKSSFLTLLHSQDGYSSSATMTSLFNKKHKFGRVRAATGDNNTSDEYSNIIVKSDQQTIHNGHLTTRRTLNFSGEKPSTPILDTINYPIHMKNLSLEELEKLADELREEIVYTVSKTGGHLSSSLGVAELTVALHHVFNTPEDKIIWDVGHQTYPHKILTGRRSRMHTIRQTCGLAGFPKREESVHDAFGAGHSSTSISAGLAKFLSSSLNDTYLNTYPHKILTGRRSRMHTIRQTCGLAGFPKREESVYDAFGAGHSSTSISAGLGMAVGRDLVRKNNHVIAVIGDGAMTAGQAYEAMNNAGYLDTNLIIILNDNAQVSLPTATVDGPASPVGALSKALTRLQSSRKFRQLREAAKGMTKQLMGSQGHEIAAKMDSYMRGMVGGSGASLFEELGLYYIGPVDGHNVEDLVHILKDVKSLPAPGPVLIHILTEKGKGYAPAEVAADKMHGVVKFEPKSGKQLKTKSKTKSYTQYFAESLVAEGQRDEKIVAIHAAMGGGTGLNLIRLIAYPIYINGLSNSIKGGN